MLPRSLAHATAVLQLRYRRKTGKTFSLEQLLYHAIDTQMQATDPKDLVFALLGVARDAGDLGIRVDYDMPYEMLYTAVAVAQLQRGHLHIFALCISSAHLQDLPSWAPDFAPFIQPQSQYAAHSFSGIKGGRLYAATRDSRASLSFYTLACEEALRIDGFSFDTVRSVGSVKNTGVQFGKKAKTLSNP